MTVPDPKKPALPRSPESVDVIVPTFRRPEGLRCALTSLFAQNGLTGTDMTIIVCDNSPEAGAQTLVEQLRPQSPFRLIYVHEPSPGVANARNTALTVSTGAFIAFLDDDEDAPPVWLSRLMAAQARFDADVVFGPVTARLPDATHRFAEYFQNFFSRSGPQETQVIDHYYGCGNSLIRASALPEAAPFSVWHNELGGEDDLLFSSLSQNGARIVWAADAAVFEDVPPSRARIAYTLKRGFAYGQGPSHLAGEHHRWVAVAGWMAQGAVQAIIFGGIAAVLFALGRPQAAPMLDKASRGFGKLFWFPPFKMKFYGQSLLRKTQNV